MTRAASRRCAALGQVKEEALSRGDIPGPVRGHAMAWVLGLLVLPAPQVFIPGEIKPGETVTAPFASCQKSAALIFLLLCRFPEGGEVSSSPQLPGCSRFRSYFFNLLASFSQI